MSSGMRVAGACLFFCFLAYQVSAEINLDDYQQLKNSCLYETKELFGLEPLDAVYKTDETLLEPDSYTQSVLHQVKYGAPFSPNHMVSALKVCSDQAGERIINFQILLGAPGETEFGDLLFLHNHGQENNSENKCSYLLPVVQEQITEMKIWKSNVGISHIRFVTSNNRSLEKGIDLASFSPTEVKTLYFDSKRSLIGFKSLSQGSETQSIGVIILDR